MLVFIGYLIIAVIVVLMLRNPYYGILLTFFAKPVIDMFWESKYYGYISPLFITAIIIPALALIRIQVNKGGAFQGRYSRVILTYLAIFGFITLLKIMNSPKYAYNSIDSYARMLSVTSFYFIGQHFFNNEKRKKQLSLAIIFSAVIPFLLTVFQVVTGETINKPMFWEEGGRSAFYLGGRHEIVRISGVYEGVYELAFMGLFVALILISIWFSRVRFPLWGYPLLTLGVYFLYNTFSRSAWMLFVFSLALFAFIRKKYAMLVTFLLIILILYAAIPAIQYRFEDEIGFIKGEKEFGQIGYSRGNVWTRTWNDFRKLDLFSKLVGTYGMGNPENQFLGLLVWFGILGLSAFTGFIAYLTWLLWKHRRRVQNDGSFSANIRFLFIAIIIGGYWLAGLGNYFITMISTQWVLWTWTGILLNDPGYRRSVAPRPFPAAASPGSWRPGPSFSRE